VELDVKATSDPDIDPFGVAKLAAHQVAERTGVPRHDVAVILGSGWLAAADRMGDVATEIPVTDLVGFPAPSVAGHAGALRSIAAGPKRILAFLGRVHMYEGHSPAAVVHAVRTAVMAGCRIIVLTNAAGGINREYSVGQAVLIADHINLTGQSPLRGPTPPAPFDVRFVDMTTAYSRRLRDAARMVDPSLAEGVYAAFPGPQFETPAEVRMAAQLGADLAGMSTVLETIAARHLGAEVLACSLVTNMAAGLEPGEINHEEVLTVGRQSAEHVGGLLAEMIGRL
jgi:purine-nucleoside phosphorylase